MLDGNDLLKRAHRCRMSAKAIRREVAKAQAVHNWEHATRRQQSAERLDALADGLERQARETPAAPT